MNTSNYVYKDAYIPYKQIPENYKVISIFPDESNQIFDWNIIDALSKLYYNKYLTSGTIRVHDDKIEIENEHLYTGPEYTAALFQYLSREYMDSAIKLAEIILSERDKNIKETIMSPYLNPCAFLCRHAVELKLKQCVCAQSQNASIKTHKLKDLWEMIDTAKLDANSCAQLKIFIEELSEIDANGESIRYGVGKDLLPLQDKTNYDCIAVIQNAMFMFNQLHKIAF